MTKTIVALTLGSLLYALRASVEARQAAYYALNLEKTQAFFLFRVIFLVAHS